MKKREKRKNFSRILIRMALASALSLLMFFVAVVFLNSLVEPMPYFWKLILMQSGYALVFYAVYFSKNKMSMQNPSSSFWCRLKDYFFQDGVYFLIIFTIMSIVCDIEMSIPRAPDASPRRLFNTICIFLFPFSTQVKIPVLRTVVNVSFAMLVQMLIAAWKYRKKPIANVEEGKSE